MPLARNTLKKYGIGSTFIETGTLRGDGVKKALKVGFSYIISIDTDRVVMDKAQYRLRKPIRKGRVKLIIGDSAEQLRLLLSSIEPPATIWLDAHAQGSTAIYRELGAIQSTGLPDYTILIDDADVIGDDSHKWGYLASLESVKQKLYGINPNYNIFRVDGGRNQDILIAQPQHEGESDDS